VDGGSDKMALPRTPNPSPSYWKPSLLQFTVGVLVCVLLFSAQPIAKESYLGAALPHEPYPYTTLPIKSQFEEGKLEPFELLGAFNSPGFGEVSFEELCLKYESGSWSWLVTRTEELQGVVNAKWVWKPVGGQEFIIEAWNARPDRVGDTAMIIFKDGKVYQSRYPGEVHLMDFDPYKADWVTVQMVINYTIPEIEELWINGYHFSHLPIRHEPIAPTNSFWQLQIFLQDSSLVLVKDIQAWK
jgi:hypothetical protein